MKPSVILAAAFAVLAAAFILREPAWTAPPIKSTSYGAPGTEMVVFKDPRTKPESGAQPDVLPAVAGGPAAGTVYRNLKVLGGVPKGEFDRTMIAITRWVSPKQGCAFCHGGAAFTGTPASYAADYPRKVIARQMLSMTRTINANWTNHVGAAGVTCWSCHAGRNFPAHLWHVDPPLVPPTGGLAGQPQAWNTTAKTIYQFFPTRPDRMFLLQGLPAHQVVSDKALATTGTGKPYPHDREYAEQVYIFMMQMSNGLGVNCTYCHQSREPNDWSQSPPARLHGYSGIKMTAMLDQNFIAPLAPWTERSQIGQMGDAPMADCKTCHQGREKPVGGMWNVVYPALIGPIPSGPANVVAATNPGIPQLAAAPRVGVPGSVRVPEYRGERQP